jgi:hypothetical protein
MVHLNDVHTANAALVQSRALVAVFFGGTSGIGHNTIRALSTAAANAGKGFRAYIVGRKEEVAESVISEARGIFPKGQFKFVKADDLSLIRSVDKVCADIVQLEEENGQDSRIDYLMMTQGGSIFLPRKGMSNALDSVRF